MKWNGKWEKEQLQQHSDTRKKKFLFLYCEDLYIVMHQFKHNYQFKIQSRWQKWENDVMEVYWNGFGMCLYTAAAAGAV